MTKATTKHVGYEFADEDVVLDFAAFENCGFKNCNIIYYGHGSLNLTECHFDETCRYSLAGPAQNTLDFLSALYNGGNLGGQELVEKTFANIRSGSLERPE